MCCSQVQAFLSSLVEEEQDEVKKELIFIKDIFIKREEAEEGEEEEEGKGGQTKDNGDLSSQLHCSTPLCESPRPTRPAGGSGGPWTLTQDQLALSPVSAWTLAEGHKSWCRIRGIWIRTDISLWLHFSSFLVQ